MNYSTPDQREYQAARISSKLYPNGEFTCGVIPQEKKSQKEEDYDRLHKLQYETVQEYIFYRKDFVEKTFWKPFDMVCDEAAAIGLSYSAICHSHEEKKPRAQRGLKGISSYQRRIIRNGAWLLQKKYGKKRLGFLTLTLPTLSQEQCDALLQHKRGWGDLVRKVTQEIQRELRRKGCPTSYVGCTEIQEKRWRRTGILAPHLHLIYVAHSGDYKYYIDAKKLRAIWKRLIENMFADIGMYANIDTKAGIDCRVIKKDAARYIAKYLSKGGKLMEEIKEKEEISKIPRCWAHCSKQLKKHILEEITTLTNDEKRAIFDGYPLEEEGYLAWLFPIDIEINGELQRMGYVGQLAEPRYQIAQNVWGRWECK